MTSLTIRLRGHTLPGATFCGPDGKVYPGVVHVGVQRQREVVNLIRGDAPAAEFHVPIEVIERAGGGIDFRGEFVHGKVGERFLYLSWGFVPENGTFNMFRRAKLHLNTIAPETLRHALEKGAGLEGELPLTDRSGGPLCASVRPPLLQWRVPAATTPTP